MNIFEKIVIYLQTTCKQKKRQHLPNSWFTLNYSPSSAKHWPLDTQWQHAFHCLTDDRPFFKITRVRDGKTYSLLLPIHSQCKIIYFSTFPKHEFEGEVGSKRCSQFSISCTIEEAVALYTQHTDLQITFSAQKLDLGFLLCVSSFISCSAKIHMKNILCKWKPCTYFHVDLSGASVIMAKVIGNIRYHQS